MRKLAVITAVLDNGKSAEVKSLFSSACTDCPSLCNKYEKSFEVMNKKGFQLKPGAFVKIEYSKPVKAAFGTFALFFPMLSAAAGFFLFPVEPVRFLSTLSGLVLGEAAVLLISRTNLKLARPEITQLI